MDKIGIVTVLYNSEQVLPEFFKTLNEQTFKDFILYVIDNASPDNSLNVAQELAKDVAFPTIFLPQQENWGVAKGNNIGIEAALKDQCDYVLLSNNDIALQPTTISTLLETLKQTGATMAAPKIYYYDSGLLWYAGGGFDFWGLNYHRGLLETDTNKFDKIELQAYSPTCFLLIESDVFNRVGMMDEKYFVYYDDTDFIWRATKKGNEKLIYVPTATLRHKEGVASKSMSDFQVYYPRRNRVYYLLKNMNPIKANLFLLLMKINTNLIKRFKFKRPRFELIKKAERDGKILAQRR